MVEYCHSVQQTREVQEYSHGDARHYNAKSSASPGSSGGRQNDHHQKVRWLGSCLFMDRRLTIAEPCQLLPRQPWMHSESWSRRKPGHASHVERPVPEPSFCDNCDGTYGDVQPYRPSQWSLAIDRHCRQRLSHCQEGGVVRLRGQLNHRPTLFAMLKVGRIEVG